MCKKAQPKGHPCSAQKARKEGRAKWEARSLIEFDTVLTSKTGQGVEITVITHPDKGDGDIDGIMAAKAASGYSLI